MAAARFGTWTDYGADRRICPEHGPQNSGPTLRRGEGFTGLWLCQECLLALVEEFAGGPELPDLSAPRG